MTRNVVLSAALLMGLVTSSHASEQEGWKFDLAQYLWAANVDGDITAGSQKAEIDSSLMDNLDAAFMTQGTISYNRFVFYFDYDYISQSNDAKTTNGLIVPVGTKVEADLDTNIATGAVGYRFDTWGDNSWVDVLVGVRNLKLDADIEVGGQDFGREEDVTDPMLLLRPSVQLSENWRFNGLFGVGISGDSESTYEVMPQFQYNFSELLSVRLGYKKIAYDMESGTKGTTDYRAFDGSYNGPFVAVGFTFPSRAKPAPAPVAKAAPPAPLPPAKCSDADNDGVCDTADQCPNTPHGKRVGQAGCDCDYTLVTHFGFDSAKLTAEDKVELDKLAEVLTNPKLNFMTGQVSGYTDSVGKPQYNQKLSERRAQAVADYLESKGVAAGSRMGVQGLGTSDPVADNKTEDGRAQNRRVVIGRTDCKK